ncbi:MAG: cell division protein FtsZ [Desulfobacteraceae bacterium]|nr:MAG: cell division protein FtsZ [Desulfobacteraceae bacterium]
MIFTYVDSDKSAKIRVIGIGGTGGNAINNMVHSELHGVKCIAIDTDAQALEISKASIRIQIGDKMTDRLSIKAAAMENIEAIRNALEGSHMVFITAGLGGSTGTGAAPVIAKICKDIGALTVAVVTKPFSFEGKKRAQIAEDGIKELKEFADTIITIPNDRLRGLTAKDATMVQMFKESDKTILHSVKGITDLIMMPGLVNLDFADVRSTMTKSGLAVVGVGIASGENRAMKAAERALSHPLLKDISIEGAQGVLMNITSTSNLTMEEMTEASELLYRKVGEDAQIIWGAVIDDSLGDEIRVTVVATGIGGERWNRVRETNRSLTTRERIFDTPIATQYIKAFPEHSFNIWLDPGENKIENLVEFFNALSELQRAYGGFGLTFDNEDDDIFLCKFWKVA